MAIMNKQIVKIREIGVITYFSGLLLDIKFARVLNAK
jgi:hypothetical protein